METDAPIARTCPNRVCCGLQISGSRYRPRCHVTICTRSSCTRSMDTFFNPCAMTRPVVPAKPIFSKANRFDTRNLLISSYDQHMKLYHDLMILYERLHPS